jgi:hypothetical protein
MVRRTVKHLLAAIFGLTICSAATAHAQTLEWTQVLGHEITGGRGASTDGLGNVYLTGYTSDDLAGPNAGHVDAFLSKYDGAGNVVWIRQLGGSGQDQSWEVSTDALGNVFIAGEGAAANVAKYDSSGSLHWVRKIPGQTLSNSVSADGRGNAYFAANGSSDAFLGKYDDAGNLLWVRQFGSTNSDESHAVTSDILGNAYIAGSTHGNLTGTTEGGVDAFVGKYDSTGNQLWIRQFGTTETDGALAVSTDAVGNVYVAGVTAGSLGGVNEGSYDTFVRKYDATGNVLWTRQLGTTSDDGCCSFGNISFDTLGIAVDGLNVYLASQTEGSLGGPNGQGETSPQDVSEDGFIAKYDADGNLRWLEQFGTGASEVASGISVDGLGNVYISGKTECWSFNVGATCTLPDGSYAFIAKYHDAVAFPPGDFNSDGTVDAADYIVWRNGLGSTYIQTDYDVWRTHFGQIAGSSSAQAGVPEPTSVALVLFAIVSFVFLYRAHHRGLPGWKRVWKPERTTDHSTRPRPDRLGGAMFGIRPNRETPLHADKLRGGEASFALLSGFQTSAHGASSGGAEAHAHSAIFARQYCARLIVN